MSWYIIVAIIVVVLVGVFLALLTFKLDHPKKIRSGAIAGSTIVIVALLIVVPRFFLSSCSAIVVPTSGVPKCVPDTLNIDGSTAMQPLITDIAKDYENDCPGATIQVSGGGSIKGLLDVENNNVIKIADSDIFTPSTFNDLDDHQVAATVFVLIANKDVNLTDLSLDQIQKIYSGNFADWKDLGHTYDHSFPIVTISRDSTSGTRFTFDKYVLKGSQEVGKITLQPTDGTNTVIKMVAQTPGAIGYVSLFNARDPQIDPYQNQINILDIEGHNYSDYINNNYPFWTVEHMYTKHGFVTPLAQAFIDYMGNQNTVKNAITTDSFKNLNDMPPDVLSTRCHG